MLTEKDYCDYDTCVALKELGYPLTSKEVRYEDKAVFVPGVLLYSAQKWLREEKKIIVYPEKNCFGWYYAIHYNVGEVHQLKFSDEYDSYEEALYAYKEAKEAHLKSVAEALFIEKKITRKVYDALISYKVEISD